MKEIYIDDLTGVYNRKFLFYWIETEIKRANRFASKFALILLDIDNFRDINNTLGHLEGDKILIQFSNFLRKNIREVDNVVRYGGDEFIALMPNTNTEGALELAQRIFTNLNAQEILTRKILCSIGFAVFPDDGTTIEALINQADNLMYQAKKQGKNRIGLKSEITKKINIPSPITIGRDNETNWCLNQLKDYNALFVAGEAGIGKTRLVLEVKNRLNNVITLRGNSYAALSSVPYHPFKNMFNELLNKDFALIQKIFKQIPETHISAVIKLFPGESIPVLTKTLEMDKFHLFDGVTKFILKMSEMLTPNMIILFLDDLHWIDRPSCELLDFIIRSAKENVKHIGTFRIEEINNSQIIDFLGIWAREKLYTRITLPPLNELQCHQLLEAMMGLVPQEATRFIYHQSGGNPFYIEEIIRELERQKRLYWNGREWVFSKDLELELTIPASVEETIKRKLKFVAPEVKEFLDIAAVFGQEFGAEFIALASRKNVGEILDALDELNKLGFIKERTPENYFFSEDIVRQVVYKNISKADLLKYHKSVGESIENLYPSALQNYFEQLATHFTIANDVTKALYYSRQAAAKAKDNYAHSLAIEFFENALKYEDNIEEIFNIKFALAEIYYLTGDYKHATINLNTCLRINPNAYKVYNKLGKVYEDMGDYKEGLKCYYLGLKKAKGTDAKYSFMTAIAWVYTRLGQYIRAKKMCEEILKLKRKLKKQELRDTHNTLGVVYLRLGVFNKAQICFNEALRISEAIGDKKLVAACYVNLALNYSMKLKEKLCESFYKKALNLYEEIGYQEGIAITLLDLGAFYSRYDIEKALELYLKAIGIAKLIGAKRTLIYLYSNLGYINFRRLMDDQALSNYQQAIQLARETKFNEGLIFSNLSLSEFYRETGQIKKGKLHLSSAQRIANKINLKYPAIDCLMEEIEYLLLTKAYKRAESLSKKLLLQLKLEHDLGYKVYEFLYRGKVLVALRKFGQAHKFYDKAYKIVKSLPNSSITAEIYYLKGSAYKQTGKMKESLKMLLKANKIFEKVRNLRYLDKIEEEIARTDISTPVKK